MSTEYKFVALLSVGMLLGIAVAAVAWSEGYLRTTIVMACVSTIGFAVLLVLLYQMHRGREVAEENFRHRLLTIIVQVIAVIGLVLGTASLVIELSGQSHLYVLLQGIWVVIFCAGFLYISFSHKNRVQ
jgi:hypothetical protein